MNAPVKRHLMDITARPEIVFARGEGSWLWDVDGRRYLDFVQGWAVNCLGHSHPAIVDALTKQGATLINASPAFYNGPALALSERLATLSGLASVFLCSSGAEANEGAIKLARKWGKLNRGGAYKIVTFENAFHGRTLGAQLAGGSPALKDWIPGAHPEYVQVPFPDGFRTADTSFDRFERSLAERGVDGFPDGLGSEYLPYPVELVHVDVDAGLSHHAALPLDITAACNDTSI